MYHAVADVHAFTGGLEKGCTYEHEQKLLVNTYNYLTKQHLYSVSWDKNAYSINAFLAVLYKQGYFSSTRKHSKQMYSEVIIPN